jgi:hypothetical protein
MKLKVKDIPALRDKIAVSQNGNCWLCKIDLRCVTACLDHDHETGLIRGVLCQNCNGIEGKISNLARRAKRNGTRYDFIVSILGYWNMNSAHQRPEIHPTHKTSDEKRLRRNKKAREKRKKR